VELHTCALGVEKDYERLTKYFFRIKTAQKGVYPYYYVTNSEEIMQKYDGQYDNLLYFFKYMYEHIRSIYNKRKLKAHKRPIF